MKRSAVVTLGLLVASVSLTAASCSSEPDHAQVCVDEKTQKRVEDDDCRKTTVGGPRWFYIPYAAGAPAVGSNVDTTKGSFTKPSTGRVTTVQRGGFGSRGGGGGA